LARAGAPGGLGVGLLLALLFAASSARGQGHVREKVDETRSVMVTWYEINDKLSKESSAWRGEKQTLEDLIEIRRTELETVRQRTAEARARTATATAKKRELEARRDELVAAAAVLRDSVAAFENRTRALLTRLPEPIVEKVRSISQSLPDPSDTSEDAEAAKRRTLSSRIITVLGILNEVNRFQREITVVPERRTLPSGINAQVTAMYLGIGQGYFVTVQGDAAAVGTSTDMGWVWIPVDESAADIAKAIAIAQNDAPAAFVPLPVRIR